MFLVMKQITFHSFSLRCETLSLCLVDCSVRWVSTELYHIMKPFSSFSSFVFKVGVEGLVVSSGQLANVSDKAFVGLEVSRFCISGHFADPGSPLDCYTCIPTQDQLTALGLPGNQLTRVPVQVVIQIIFVDDILIK